MKTFCTIYLILYLLRIGCGLGFLATDKTKLILTLNRAGVLVFLIGRILVAFWLGYLLTHNN